MQPCNRTIYNTMGSPSARSANRMCQPVFTKDGEIWHKFDKSKVREVYPCHRSVRHFLVEVDHFCSFGVATHPIRCRDVTSGRFWSTGTHRVFTPRKLEVLNCTPPHSDSAQVYSKLLCIVVSIEWAQRTLRAVSANANAPGGGGAGANATFDIHRVELPAPSLFSPSAVVERNLKWETHIPKQMGSSVGVILARVDEDEDEETTDVRMFTQFFVEVGQRIEVDLSKVNTGSSAYPTMQPGVQDMVSTALEAAGLRRPSIPNGADPFHSSRGSSSTPPDMPNSGSRLAVLACAVVSLFSVGLAVASN